jgi:hypothetical protein
MPASLTEPRRVRCRLFLVFASFVSGRVSRRHDNRVILRGSHVPRRLQLADVIHERHAALGVLPPLGVHEALADDPGARDGTGKLGHDRSPCAAR